jgi:hypothetical protein
VPIEPDALTRLALADATSYRRGAEQFLTSRSTDMLNVMLTEAVKLVPTIVASAVGVLASWMLGQRILTSWQIRQRRKELQLASLAEFYSAYGEFFAVWKIWNYRLRKDRASEDDDVFVRAATMEGRVEAIVVRLAAERKLSPRDIGCFGQLRQAFQELRHAIRAGRPLRWNYSGHPKYHKLKELAAYAAASLSDDGLWIKPSPAEAQEALLAITSNDNEAAWNAVAVEAESSSAAG